MDITFASCDYDPTNVRVVRGGNSITVEVFREGGTDSVTFFTEDRKALSVLEYKLANPATEDDDDVEDE